jgi:hypothetical protein
VARKRKNRLEVEPDEILKDDDQPKAEPKKAASGMAKADFQGLVTRLAQDASNYIAEEVSQLRMEATDYYKGRLPDIDQDDAEEDRSRAVMSEVRDTVLGIMPDLLRIILGSDSVVEYKPAPESDQALFQQRTAEAAQATDYVQNVVMKVDNPDTFMTLYSVFQDALVRKTGVITWLWETSKKPIYTTHTGLTQEEAEMLVADPEVEVVGKRLYVDRSAVLGPVTLYDCKIKRIAKHGKARIKGVPCEKILVNRSATSSGDATLFGYTEEKSIGDFVDMGFSEADLKDCDRDPDDKDNLESQARRVRRGSATKDEEPPADPSQRKVRYARLYVLADRDGDGIPELNCVIAAGTKFKVLEVEPADEVPFATFCPYPEGYTFFGESMADLTMDIQRIKSRIMRDMLDSLAQSVIPQTSVIEGLVNLDDVLNPDASRVIRTRGVGAVTPHVIPFVGKEALPVLQLMDQVREGRTGMSDASQGLDPKVLQSTDKDAVHATLSRAQARIEMVARIFAETGMAQLFRGLLRLIIKNQDQARTVDLRGSWVTVDPRSWNDEMHVNVTLALGRGSIQEQLAFLTQVAAKQEQIIAELGPDNPLCSIDHYRYTLGKILELSGWKNTESFFKDPSKLPPDKKAEVMQQLAQAAAAKAQAQGGGASGPDPAIEQAKIASHEKIATMKIQHDTEMKTLELKAQFQLRALELHAQHNTALSAEELRTHANAASDHVDAATKIVLQRMKERGDTERAEISAKAKAKATNDAD